MGKMSLQGVQLEDRVVPAAGASLAPAQTPVSLDLGIGGEQTHISPDSTGPFVGLSSPAPSELTPAQMREAYGVGLISFGSQVGPVAGDGTGQTIAIVDAYDDPDIASDLQVFDQTFGLPNPPSFRKMNEYGSSNPSQLPGVDPVYGDWSIEESLDVEWAHAIAPGANIILVEANSDSTQDLFTGVTTAENLPGVSVVSLSFLAPGESASELSQASNITSSGVTVLAASGDYGSGHLGIPSISSNVVAVGGTVLSVDGDSYGSETAWSGSGGGVSKYEPEPVYQEGVQTTGRRTAPDVAFDSYPGVPIYDSYDYQATRFFPSGSWSSGPIYGTSLACPCWAGLIAIADQGRALDGEAPLGEQTLPGLYSLPSTDFHQITSGSNGKFKAGPGYNEVTGLGSPIANLLVPDLANMNFLPDATTGGFYSQTITAPAGDSVEVSLTDPTSKVAPASLGLDISVSGDQIVISGIPTKTGTLGFEITESGESGTTTQLESLTVNPDLSLFPNPQTLPAAAVGNSYSQTITPVGGSGNVKVSASVTSGVSGMSVKVSGKTVVVSGKPKSPGTLTFNVTTSDGYGTVTEGYTVNVGLTLSEASLPSAAVGVSYDQTLAANGVGSASVSLAIISTTQPADLGLSIVDAGSSVTISGLPTTAGVVTFSLSAKDGAGDVAVNYYSLTVLASGAPSVTQDPVSAGIEPGLNTTFTAAASGMGTVTVQWYVSTNNGATFTPLSPGGVYGNTVTSPTLVVTKAIASLNGNLYQAVFSNGAGAPATTASALLTVDAPVTIKGTKGGQKLAAAGSLLPFKTVSVANSSNPAELLDVQIILSNPAIASLTNLGGGSYDSKLGEYVLTGVTAAEAEAALQSLELLPSISGKTTLTLKIANAAAVAVNSATTVTVM